MDSKTASAGERVRNLFNSLVGNLQHEAGVARTTVVKFFGGGNAAGTAAQQRRAMSQVVGSLAAPVALNARIAPGNAESGTGFQVGNPENAQGKTLGATGNPGAYYRKVETAAASRDNHGISGVGTAPQVSLDNSRFNIVSNGTGKNDATNAYDAKTTGSPLTGTEGFQALSNPATRSMDTPSVYMGGRAGGHETDDGLSFDRVYVAEQKNGQPIPLTDAHGNKAYRDESGKTIFESAKKPGTYVDSNGHATNVKGQHLEPAYRFRATFTDEGSGSSGRDKAHQFTLEPGAKGYYSVTDGNGKKIGQISDAEMNKEVERARAENRTPVLNVAGHALRPNYAFRPVWRTTNSTDPKGNQWHNMPPGSPKDLYIYPGEKFTMTVEQAADNRIHMNIGLIDPNTNQVSENLDVNFKQEGFHANSARHFKRVNSIDQKGAEGSQGKPGGVRPSASSVTGAAWERVVIKGAGNDEHPLAGRNGMVVQGSDTKAAYDRIFERGRIGTHGGEAINIHP